VNNPPDTNEDRRIEARILAEGNGYLKVTGAQASAEVAASIIDVSKSGLQVEVDEAIPPASTVEIRLRNVTVEGKVEYCQPQPGNGRYRVGVLTGRMTEPSQA